LIGSAVEARALDYAIESLSRSHLAEVRERTLSRIERTRREVHSRLTYEINYWDGRAWKLAQQEAAGKQVKLPSLQARRRADDLRDRLRSRNRELDLEAQIDALPRSSSAARSSSRRGFSIGSPAARLARWICSPARPAGSSFSR